MKIKTLWDARNERIQAEAQQDHRRELKEARAKVRHWERNFAKYGGQVQLETLERMRANLAKLEG